MGLSIPSCELNLLKFWQFRPLESYKITYSFRKFWAIPSMHAPQLIPALMLFYWISFNFLK